MAFIAFTSTGSSIGPASTTFTVGTLTGGTIAVGQTLTGAGITAGTVILSNISGSGSGSTWTVNNSQTVGPIAINGAEPLGLSYDLPPQPLWSDNTWLNQGFLSPTLLTLGVNKYDWPLPTPDRRETGQRSWEWSYNQNLIGKDVLPAGGRRSYDLPILPDQRETRREVRSWEWKYNQNLIGKDKLPNGGRVLYDLPIIPDIRHIGREAYNWTWQYNLNLIGKDKLPFRQQDWPVPKAYEYHVQLRAWAWAYNLNLIGKDKLPLRQQDWPTQVGVRRGVIWDVTASVVLRSGVQAPFTQTDWPLPGVPYRDDQTWLSQGIITVTTQTQPFNQFNWPVPSGTVYPIDLRNWSNPPIQVTYVSRAPYFAYQTQQPRIDTWSQPPNLALLAQPIVLPRNQYDWPNSRSPEYHVQARNWTWAYNLNLIGKDALPIRQQDWPNPQFPTPIPQTWTSQGNALTTVVQKPFAQTDWQNPQPQPLMGETWLSQGYLTISATTPFAQYDWPNPQLVTPTAQTWIQAVNIALLAQGPQPFAQFDWPLPIGATYQNDLRTWAASYNRNLIGKDRLPNRQQDWPLPAPATQPDRTYFQPLPLAIRAFQARTIPFNQFDWPLPGGHAVATLGTRIDTVPPYITPVPPPVTVGIFTVSGPTTEDLFGPVSGVNYTWSPTQQRTA